jgi:hypothetical protein
MNTQCDNLDSERRLLYDMRSMDGNANRPNVGTQLAPRRSAVSRRRSLEEAAPNISLSHSQALWALREIGLSHGSSPTKFAHYIKHLRKLGIPFDWNHQPTRGKSATYEFDAMMELAVALSLRIYGALPDAIPTALKAHRERLKVIYREAGLGERSRLWTDAKIEGSPKTEVSGVYLELGLAFENGRYVEAGVPAALSAQRAMERFANSSAADRSWLPLNLSKIAAQLVEAAGHAPPMRSTSRRAPG